MTVTLRCGADLEAELVALPLSVSSQSASEVHRTTLRVLGSPSAASLGSPPGGNKAARTMMPARWL